MAIEFGRVLPVFRIFDESKAREFYVGFLGFKVDWEHRFQDNAPVYMRVSRGELQLYLSEHHGDVTPGSFCEVAVSNIDELHAELIAKDYKYNRPGIEDNFGRGVTVIDPFHNQIRFVERNDLRA